jgi:uncharacterized membrane protein
MFARFRMFLQKALIAGVLATLPLAVTYWFINFVFKKFSGFLQPYLHLLTTKFHIVIPLYVQNIISFSIIIFALIFIGLFARNYVGRKLLGLIEYIAENIPIVRGVYSSIRQIVEAFQTTSGSSFKKVVMIEYPRKGIYSLGFVTKDTSEFLNKATGEVCVNVFIPTTPNPTSGFILIVPKKDVIDPGMPIEQCVKFIISAGLVENSEKKNGKPAKEKEPAAKGE